MSKFVLDSCNPLQPLPRMAFQPTYLKVQSLSIVFVDTVDTIIFCQKYQELMLLPKFKKYTVFFNRANSLEQIVVVILASSKHGAFATWNDHTSICRIH